MKHTKLADTLKTAAVLALTTAIGFLLEAMGLSQTNVITVYILGVLVVAAVTSSRWYSTAASLTSVLLFNYIFTEPMFVLKAEDAGTQLTLLITFLAAVFTSTYTVQIKEKPRTFPRHPGGNVRCQEMLYGRPGNRRSHFHPVHGCIPLSAGPERRHGLWGNRNTDGRGEPG